MAATDAKCAWRWSTPWATTRLASSTACAASSGSTASRWGSALSSEPGRRVAQSEGVPEVGRFQLALQVGDGRPHLRQCLVEVPVDRGAEREDLHVRAQCLHGQDLGQDEGLGEPRVHLQHVTDARSGRVRRCRHDRPPSAPYRVPPRSRLRREPRQPGQAVEVHGGVGSPRPGQGRGQPAADVGRVGVRAQHVDEPGLPEAVRPSAPARRGGRCGGGAEPGARPGGARTRSCTRPSRPWPPLAPRRRARRPRTRGRGGQVACSPTRPSPRTRSM